MSDLSAIIFFILLFNSTGSKKLSHIASHFGVSIEHCKCDINLIHTHSFLSLLKLEHKANTKPRTQSKLLLR